MLPVAIALSLIVGLMLGLLGGGGSVLLLPVLVYLLRLPTDQAMTLSLLVLGTTSAFSLIPHGMSRNVRWPMGLLFGACGMVGSTLGSLLNPLVPAVALMGGFALLMVATALVMLRGKPSTVASDTTQIRWLRVVLLALVVGALAGLLGAGGGFLVVPSLVVFGGLAMREAIGTSLLVIAMQSFVGFGVHLRHSSVSPTLAVAITLSTVVGSLVGARFSTRISQEKLRTGVCDLRPGVGGVVVVHATPSGVTTVGTVRIMNETTPELLDKARAGDERALQELLVRHQSQLYRFSLKMCRDEQDAQDVLQETLIALARGVRDFRGESSLSTWLFTVARSYCIKKHRKSTHAPKELLSLETTESPELLKLASDQQPPDEALASKRVEAALEQAIHGLEPSYREVLLLRDVEGLTAPEVAQIVGISVPAVKSRLHRARIDVREKVAPLLGIPIEPANSQAGPCPDVLLMYSQHLEGEISADLCAQMEHHLQGCKRCKGTCDSLKRTLALCRMSPRASSEAESVPAEIQNSVRVAIQHFLSDTKT